MTLVEFLTARLREDEYALLTDLSPPEPPYRGFRDIEIKREIIRRSALYGRDLLLLLAAVYNDHPDYNPEWALCQGES